MEMEVKTGEIERVNGCLCKVFRPFILHQRNYWVQKVTVVNMNCCRRNVDPVLVVSMKSKNGKLSEIAINPFVWNKY